MCIRDRGTRRAALLGKGLVDYGQGPEEGLLWAQLEAPVAAVRMLLVPVLTELAGHVLVRHTPGLQGAVVVQAGKGRALPAVQTAGVNFPTLARHADVVDLNEVRCSPIGVSPRSPALT